MVYVSLLTLLAIASSTARAAYVDGSAEGQCLTESGSGGAAAKENALMPQPARETRDSAVRSGLIPTSGSVAGNSARLSAPSTDDGNFSNFLLQQQQPSQTFQTLSGNGLPSSGSRGQDGQAFSTSSFGVAVVATRPRYEEHVQVNSGVRPVTTTITNTVTQTHTLRVPSTSDVWVTSVTMMKMPVTQLFTQRSYVPVAANTVTSVIRITKTPIEVVTRTEEIYPTKTLVSVFTRFVTTTETVELWQNIVHRATNYEVLTVPVVETQTLLQRLFTTTTVTRVVNVTSVQSLNLSTFARSGEVTATAGSYY